MLRVHDLTVARGDRVLFSGLCFELEAGTARVVMGANGAGKTSLLRAVAGLLRPLAGQISLTDYEDRQAGLYLMGHQDGLKGGRTAGEAGSITRILVCGGSALTPGLTEFLNRRFRVNAEIVNPLARIQYDPALFAGQDVAKVAPLLTVGIGLALRRQGDKK